MSQVLSLRDQILPCKTSFCIRGEARDDELAINFLGHSRSGLAGDREIGVAKAEFSQGISIIRILIFLLQGMFLVYPIHSIECSLSVGCLDEQMGK